MLELQNRRMKPISDMLSIRRTCVVSNGAPRLSVLLFSGEHAVLRYVAGSLADAERYERHTLRALSRACAPALIDSAIRCRGCGMACPYPDLAIKELPASERQTEQLKGVK